MIEKIKRYILGLTFVRRTIILLRAIKLPFFDGMSLYDIIKFLSFALKNGEVSARAATISFYIILSIFPVTIVILSLIPYINYYNFQDLLLLKIEEYTPHDIYELIDSMISDLILKKHTAVLSIGFLLTLYYASNSMNAMLNALNKSFQLSSRRNPVKQRALSVLLMFIFPFFFLLGITIISLGEEYLNLLVTKLDIHNYWFNLGFRTIEWVLSIMLIIFAISTLYNFANLERKRWKFFSSGASFATLGIILISLVLNYYLSNFGSYNKLYGSIGSVIGVMMWIYLVANIIIIGFEIYTKTNHKEILSTK